MSLDARAMAVAVSLAPHPRLILDEATLAQLRGRAAANTPQWQILKAKCDSLIGGTVEYPAGPAYPPKPGAGSGYQGEEYLPAVLAEGMCYQVLRTSDPTAAAAYGAKAADILVKMSAPYSTQSGNLGQNPCNDSGYGMRFYGVGFGLGYDWVYELLTPAQRTQVYTTANAWIDSWEAPGGCSGFEYEHPQSNYFAGYFHAKAAIALATYGENPSAPAQWQDWLDNQFGKRVRPYYNKHLLGGGWPEGYGNYATLGVFNMSFPIREVKTATGIDLVHASEPFTFPLDSADYAMHFSWPSRDYFDDRDTNRSNTTDVAPGTNRVGLFTELLGELIFWNSPKVAVFHQYLNEVSVATNNYSDAAPWLAFLEDAPDAPTSPLSSLPRSYFAPGLGAVAARSDWTKSASWMSFRAGPYVNNPAQGEEYFDQGSLALVRGKLPLLVNATGWIVHNPGGPADDNLRYTDNFGRTDGSILSGNRQLYNVFYVRNMNGATVLDRYGQVAYTTEDNQVRTRVSGFEDRDGYVYLLATNLEDMYRKFSAGPAVASWSRQIVYLRPHRFVVYDRTRSGSTSYDQFMAWHFPANPAQGSAPTGDNRLDITYDGQYVGAMITVLPANAALTTLPMYPTSNPVKVWQTQVRAPSSAVDQQWMTVFDMSPGSTSVATAKPVDVVSGAVVGVQLAASDGNSVVVSGTATAGTPIATGFGYRVVAAAAHHIITDLVPNTGYAITAVANGAVQTVNVTAGGTSISSSQGVLSFYLDASGGFQQSPLPISTLPVSTVPVKGYPRARGY